MLELHVFPGKRLKGGPSSSARAVINIIVACLLIHTSASAEGGALRSMETRLQRSRVIPPLLRHERQCGGALLRLRGGHTNQCGMDCISDEVESGVGAVPLVDAGPQCYPGGINYPWQRVSYPIEYLMRDQKWKEEEQRMLDEMQARESDEENSCNRGAHPFWLDDESLPREEADDIVVREDGQEAAQGEEAAEDEVDESGGYPTLTAEDGHALNVGSLCLKCRKQGVTRILPSTIPWFGKVLVMSFECQHCGEANTEVQSAAEIQPFGHRITLNVSSREDADRQVIRTRCCTVTIPELKLEMPATPSGAILTTVEGLLLRAAEDLEMDQDSRETTQRAQIAAVVHRLRVFAGGGEEGEWQWYTVVLDDPSGNSQIEGGAVDHMVLRASYARTKEQNAALGMYPQEASAEAGPQEGGEGSEVTCESAEGGGGTRRVSNQGAVKWSGHGGGQGILRAVAAAGGKEVESFQVGCPSCGVDDVEKMYLTDIPHFGEILIMAFNCGACGYRSTEIKPGSSGRRGRRIELRVERDEDWDRLVLKGAGCKMVVPELELELESGAMGSTLTTVEGLLEKVYEHLASTRPFTAGDSHSTATSSFAKGLQVFLARLDDVRKKRETFTLILEDPLGHSNIEPPRSATESGEDVRMMFEEFDFDEDAEQDEGYFEEMD